MSCEASKPQSHEAPPVWCADYVQESTFVDHGRGERIGWSTRGFDCWGLVLAVLAEQFGIAGLPDYKYASAHAHFSVATAFADGMLDGKWRRVEIPAPGDVIVLRIAGRPWHCAIAVGGEWMLHTMQGAGTMLEQWTRPIWANRIEGIYRSAAVSDQLPAISKNNEEASCSH